MSVGPQIRAPDFNEELRDFNLKLENKDTKDKYEEFL
jgi:hypothetical protein